MEQLFDHIIPENTIESFTLHDGYKYKRINTLMQGYICTLIKNNFMIFDYTPFCKTDKKYARSNLSAFIRKDLVQDFASNISQKGNIVCIFTKDGSIVFENGIPSRLDVDYVVQYKIVYDKNSNPHIENTEHIWDYGSDFSGIKKLCSEESYLKIKRDYVEIAVFSSQFDDNIILDTINDYINQ